MEAELNMDGMGLTTTTRFICAGLLFSAALFANGAEFSGRVVAVADGDTLTVLTVSKIQHRVRLAGIDAPEKRQAYGQQAKQSLSDLVFRREVTVQTHRKDRYGRDIGKVRLDGLDVNLEQIKRGMAWHYKAYENEESEEDRYRYSLEEVNARRQRIGLWRDDSPSTPWDFRRH